jgi:hypothetical protein
MSLAHRGVLFPDEIAEFPDLMTQNDPFANAATATRGL